jgi:uncharacterized protein YodC (DUF2158 family)
LPPSCVFQVSSSSFLLAAQTRWRRGNTRKQALVHMRELLTDAVRVGGVTHLVGPVTMVLQGGPRLVVSFGSHHPSYSGRQTFQDYSQGLNVGVVIC